MRFQKRFLTALLFWLPFIPTKAQTTTTIRFGFDFGQGTVHKDDLEDTPTKGCLPFCVSELKFYISNIKLIHKGNLVWEKPKIYQLVDIKKPNSLQITLKNEENIIFDELRLDVGIDSSTNTAGVMGGDLDPTKGMYWAWQSGYINFKLEGNSQLCKTRNQEFQFHLGGYRQGENCLQTLIFPLKNPNEINIRLDVEKILQQMDLSNTNHIMSPSAKAVDFSKIVARAFTILSTH